MDTLTTVILKPGEADRIVAGHPWIYHGEILRLTTPATDGDLVQVKDHRQRLLGAGFYNSNSKINVRVLAPDRITVDQEFFEERIRAALAVRQRHLPNATSFRVVNAESDFLSGLIVDKYEDVLVVQISALGMDQRKEHDRGRAAKNLFAARHPGTQRRGLAQVRGPGRSQRRAGGRTRGKVSVNLNGLKFETDLAAGHKTGMYLDQQANYQAVSHLPKADRCWTASAFSAASVCTPRGPARRRSNCWTKVPTPSPPPKRNAATNGLADKCSFETINVFDWLKANTAVKPHERVIPRYDLIILDPPSFTRNRASVPDALRGYKEIHLRALKLLKPGGTLATFCCSHHVGADLFLDSLLSAAYDTRHILRRVATYAQSPDHPIIPMIPETEYLKGFAFEKVR